MLYESEQTLLNELKILLANLLVALWRMARRPTAADRLLAAINGHSVIPQNSHLNDCLTLKPAEKPTPATRPKPPLAYCATWVNNAPHTGHWLDMPLNGRLYGAKTAGKAGC